MSEFKPGRTVADLNLLDDDEIVAGYRDGLSGAPMPGSDKSRSYWHGWRNAQVDRGWAQAYEAPAQRAREYVGRYVGLQ